MTKTIFALAAVLLFSLTSQKVAAASAPKTCAALLQSQRPAEDLLRLLSAMSPDARSRVEWIWIAESISLTDLKNLKTSAHARGLQVFFDQFLANENQVIGQFHLNGSVGHQAEFADLVAEMKGQLKWTEASMPDVEKRPLRTWEEMKEGLNQIGLSLVPFQSGLSEVENEMVVIHLREDTYMSPRIAYVVEQENMQILDLGRFDDFETAFKAWKPLILARVRIGSNPYLLVDREVLEAFRSVKRADLLKSGVRLDLDINSWLRKRLKTPPSAKVTKVGPAPLKAPAHYGATEWAKGKYKNAFQEDAIKRGAARPFAVIRWSKAPAWAVVNAYYLEEHGVHATLGALEAWVPVPIRRAVLAQLERYVEDPESFKAISHTKLGGSFGKNLLNKMIETDDVKVFAPRDFPEDRVVVFPLGSVWAGREEEPPAKSGDLSFLNGADHSADLPVPVTPAEPLVRERPAAKIEFVPGTGYQTKLVDLNSFEDQVLAAARALPGEGDVAVEQDNQGTIMRYHVTYRSEEGAPVQILSLRHLDESEIVPSKLEFTPSSQADKILSDKEAFKKRLFKVVNLAIPAPGHYGLLEILVDQNYKGRRELLRIRFSEDKGTIEVHDILVQRLSQMEAFYDRFAAYHQISGGTYAHDLPDIRVGTKNISTIVIPPSVRARNEFEHDITPEMEQKILSEIKVAAKQPDSQSYLSRVQVEQRDFVVNLRVRGQAAILREIYPAP